MVSFTSFVALATLGNVPAGSIFFEDILILLLQVCLIETLIKFISFYIYFLSPCDFPLSLFLGIYKL